MIKNTKDISNTKVDICVYGGSGTGKTRMLSTLPDDAKLLVLDADNGMLTLKSMGANIDFWDLNDLDNKKHRYLQIMDFFKYISSKECTVKYNWIAVDSFTAIADSLEDYLKNVKNLDGFEFWRVYGEQIKKMISGLRCSGYNTISIFEVVEKSSELSATSYRFNVKGAIQDRIPYLYDLVFASRTKKTKDGTNYLLQTKTGQGWSCKDRSNKLETFEDADFSAILTKIWR